MAKKILFLVITLSLCLSGKAAPVTVNVPSAGTLKAQLEGSYVLAEITDLTVTGTIDAQDFRLIRDSLSNLVSLNLSATTIAAYSGTGGTNVNGMNGSLDFQTTYAANAIPAYAFYVKQITGMMGFPPPVLAPEKKLKLQSLQLPSSITAIGNYALGKQLNLTSTTLDLSGYTQLETLGDYVFYQDSTLVSILLPASVKTIGYSAFQDCAALTSFTVPAATTDLGGALLSGCVNISEINFQEPSSLTAITSGFFAGMANLKKVKIPASITTMPVDAFIYGNTYFTGDSILVDPANTAFASDNGILYDKTKETLLVCPQGITAPVIPAGVVNIGNQAFRYGKLTAVAIPASVKSIGTNAFSNSKIVDLSFAAGSVLESIANQAFYRDTFLVAVNLPAGLKTIGNEVFNGADSLKTITLPAGITSIGNSVFAYSGLVSADFSAIADTTALGASTFQQCKSLSSVTFPAKYRTIPGSTFSSCTELKSFVFPDSIKTISATAFDNSGLETVTLPEGLTSIGENAFRSTPLRSVFLPKTVTSLTVNSYGSPFNRTPGRITVHPENETYSSVDGILYNKDTTNLIEAPTFLSGAFVIPKTVKTIEAYAFQGNTLLTSVELPDSLAATQPVKNYAFSGCSALKQIIVKNQTPPEFTTSQYPFNSISATPALYVPKGTVDAYKAANQWKNFTTVEEASLFYDLGYGYPYKISPNGKYLTGYNGFLWENKENGDNSVTLIPSEGELSLNDVNDSGVIAANFKDPAYVVNGSPITSGGVYKEGAWYSLGLGRYGSAAGSSETGSSVNAITADGWVFGMSYEKGSAAKVVPMVWKPDQATGQYTDTLVYSFPEDNLPAGDRIQGTRFLDASADGSVACGWAVQAATHGARQSIVWTSPTEYKIIAPETLGEAHDVSPNGKYVALTTGGKAALYDVENDSLIVFGPAGTTASAVSNDGLMVGFRTVGEGRKGFLWSDKLGYIELKDFIEKYTPEITLSEDFQFSNDENDYYMDVPMTISGDGLVISGYRGAGVMRKIWVIALPAPLDLVSRPHKLTADVAPQTRKVVQLSWEAPEDIAGHNLDFYAVYRNGIRLGGLIPADASTYTDTDAPAGYVSYSVSAIYDYSAGTFRESNQSEPVTATIIDNYDLPFYEGFDAGYQPNYWETTESISSAWSLSGIEYKSALGASAVFITAGDQSSYSQTLTTKPLDATGKTKVTASFLYELRGTGDLWVGVKDTIYFEVSDIQATEWTVVKSYVLSGDLGWTTETLDITDLVQNKIFRARFRAVSGANRNGLAFDVDDFAVAVASVNAPGEVKATRKIGNNDVKVVWQDPSGSYALTYAQSPKRSTTIGNEGVPFIAVNKFDSLELRTYKDLYLTSVSAYINAKGRNATKDTKLKLAVFENNTRVVTQDIDGYEGDAWNTFALNTPLLITASANLAFGIEVEEHDSLSYPLATDITQGIAGKSDAFSEDGGATWQTLADWDFPYSWSIIGNVRASAAASERTPGILGYEIYRDGTKINSVLTFGQAFTDTTLTAAQAANYAVKAYYLVGGVSGLSAASAITDVETAILPVSGGNISIYPNPANEFIRVDGEFSSLVLFDLTGRKVLEARKSPVKVESLGAGTYVLEVIAGNGAKTVSKVIIRK
jgi:hypothetical protein